LNSGDNYQELAYKKKIDELRQKRKDEKAETFGSGSNTLDRMSSDAMDTIAKKEEQKLWH